MNLFARRCDSSRRCCLRTSSARIKSLAVRLLDCNYTYLNARLAKLYGISGVTGNDMRKVHAPQGTAPAAVC